MPKVSSNFTWTYRHWAAALLMLAVGVFATLEAWREILLIAMKDEESSQVWLVLPVAGWLVWVRRGRFRFCQPAGTFAGPVLVAVGWALTAWGYTHAAKAAVHLGAVCVPVGCVLSVLGRDLVRRFFPAFAVLVFLVPIPGIVRQQISVPMMTTTASVTASISEVLGVPVERTGNLLLVNGEPVSIVEACNGLRMVFSLFLVSFAFAFGEPLRHYVRLLIVLASPLSAIVCNVIRLVPTLWMYGYSNQTLAHRFHDAAGWVMLVVGFLLLMGIIRLLRWALIPVAHYTLASD
jgi:exosortase